MSADQLQQQYVGHNSSTQAAVLVPAAITLTLSLLLYATRIRARRSSPFIWTDGMIAAALLVKMPFAVKALDHVVLTCRNINATVKFYNLLGMKHEVFHSSKDAPGVERHALSFGQQKLNLHQAGAEFEPKATLAKPGTADLCFITTTPITEVLAELQKEGLEILEEGKVVDRVGAVGKLKSVYTRDPDGNLIEVSNYV
ncbi:Glyoxalase/Bleomycin resistance protein/Dihydroxybiphenyl dioxygenase, partial [Aureobasidium melanogenum]